MEKKLFKELIQDIYYTSLLPGLYTMDPPSSIEQVKEEMRKCGENPKYKCKFQEVINSRMTLGYIWRTPNMATLGLIKLPEMIYRSFLETI